jgi:hypothetical protein
MAMWADQNAGTSGRTTREFYEQNDFNEIYLTYDQKLQIRNWF